MSLWNRKRPLNQPPGFRQVGQQREAAPKADTAAQAVRAAQFERQDVTKRLGQRAVVRG